MNGAADLGGMMGFGPVQREDNEPPFHAEWERRAFALTLAMGATGSWTLDASRFARESLPPAEYLSSSYYAIWFNALLKLMRERGLLVDGELEEGRVLARKPVARVLHGNDVAAAMARGSPTEREPAMPARFTVGDRVRARNMHPRTHTRLPRYLRGHAGEIVRVHGVHVFPDTNAHGGGEDPRWLYSVRFAARELWGDGRAAHDSVTADCWEPYLEPA
ncbi:MAG: nitrile hydratase subunit beta [Rhizobiales bacterium 65-79]|jgi:nitrile hydratase|nr:nitrile hydratase subunit beta [Hyphomicrobiales bacterium]OJU06097.1 MAG: nitrile hydratase subunit beta [Rhizobiales bacterium 65-79]